MINFEFFNPAKIIFGKGVIKNVGTQIRKYNATKVLLVYGGGSIKRSGIYDEVIKSLNKHNIEFIELCGVQPNPRLSKVREGAKICIENNVDFILAVGGGSVIDTAKGIGVAVTNDKDVWSYYMSGEKISNCLPIGVILTIPAAGSETSYASVITNEDGGFKRGIHDNVIIPKFAMLDPETTYSLPAYQTACGVSDILAHLMERYFTLVENVELTDRMIEGAAVTIINNGIKVLAEPHNYDVRAEIMLTSTFAHNNMLDCGRIGDWGSHNVEHELSGTYDIAHGAGLSIIFPAWIRYVWKVAPKRFARFAREVWGVQYYPGEEEYAIEQMLDRMESWYKRLGLPTKLSQVGINDSQFEQMAHRALVNREDGIGQLYKLKENDIIEIFKLAL